MGVSLKKRYRYFIAICLLLALGGTTYAQSLKNQKAGLRYEVDAKRIGTDMFSDDGLPRSREFKRIDSTYYVGWLYEGAYKYERAADYMGYKRASEPLERAMRLMERDYARELGTRSSDLMTYYPAYRFQLDYTRIASLLRDCYASMEEAGKEYNLLQRVLKWNMQNDYYLDAYNFLGWMVHRNRIYTDDKYWFLKNSIDANEDLAHKYLDSQIRRIYINKRLNKDFFPAGYERNEILGVYHYKSILYSYELNIDSATYYYDKMRKSPIFPHNNYATFRSICGDFREAEKEYEDAVAQDAGDKRLKEWAYYRSIISLYKAQPEEGIDLLKDMIKANGSTPGFGWYNIALGRAKFYNGELSESKRYTEKAATFKELHIGTTLGQTHYDFSVQLIKLINKMAEYEQLRFEDRNWWYHPGTLASMASTTAEQYAQQFLIINQLAQNPERERVVYKLFSTESTVCWDEIWYLIKDFSTKFFINKFEKELKNDERKHIQKYFQLFIAKLKMEQDKYKEARVLLDEILLDPNIDMEYEQLFLARVYEAQAICAKEGKDDQAYNSWMYRMYNAYPQLIPYTGLRMNINLNVTGTDEELTERLKNFNINWGAASTITPRAFIAIAPAGEKKKVTYSVVAADGRTIVPQQSIIYDDAEKTGKELAYKLFKIGVDNAPDEDKDENI